MESAKRSKPKHHQRSGEGNLYPAHQCNCPWHGCASSMEPERSKNVPHLADLAALPRNSRIFVCLQKSRPDSPIPCKAKQHPFICRDCVMGILYGVRLKRCKGWRSAFYPLRRYNERPHQRDKAYLSGFERSRCYRSADAE